MAKAKSRSARTLSRVNFSSSLRDLCGLRRLSDELLAATIHRRGAEVAEKK